MAECVLTVILILLSILTDNISARTQTPSTTCVILTPSGGVINLEPLANEAGTHRLVTSHLGTIFSFDPCPLAPTNVSNSNASHIQSILGARVLYLRDRSKTKHISLGTANNVLPPKFKPNTGCHSRLRHSTPSRKDCSLITPPHPQTISEEHEPKNVRESLMKIRLPTIGSHVGIDDDTRPGWVEVHNSRDWGPAGHEDESNADAISSSGTSDSKRDAGTADEDYPVKVEHKRKSQHIRPRPYPENITAVLRFKMFKGRCKGLRSYILLQCGKDLDSPQRAVFQRWNSSCPRHLYFILTHKCCCEGGCFPEAVTPWTDRAAVGSTGGTREETMASQQISRTNLLDWLQKRGFRGDNLTDFEMYIDGLFETGTEGTVVPEEGAPKFMWLIVVVNIGVIGAAICIAAMCCRSGGGGAVGSGHGPYGYVPALHSSRLTIASSVESFLHQPASVSAKSAEYLDYSSPIAKSSKLPQLSDCTLASADLEIGQRLGGGLFGDTYLAEWKDRAVAAKRLTVGVHQGQLNDLDRKWIINQVEILSRHRHKNLVAVFGVVLDSRQPYVISEYVECESLKDQLTRKIDGSFTWTKKVKICSQVADALVFLHSTKPPIIHRDLRCANVLIDRYDKVKVVDHALTKITQRLRQGCSGRKGCYCQKDICALPASFRWTSPELLSNPQAEEQEHDVITEECDVYSYAMVLWEVASHCDPFEDIPDENEVRELVITNVRPRVDILIGLIPQLKELMIACWDDNKENRPSFKQIVIHLKRCQHVLSKMAQTHRTKKNSSTTYLKSTLNMSE